MIARYVAIICFGLFLGALYMLYERRAPFQTKPLTASNIICSTLYTPDKILYIDMHDEGILYVHQEEGSPTLHVEADQVLLPFIDITLHNATATLRLKQGNYSLDKIPKPQFYLVTSDIAAITLSGHAQIITKNTLQVDSLDINAQGNSNITATINTKELDVQSYGASTVKLSGTALEQHLELHGASRYEAQNLTSLECSIHASGASTAYINAKDKLYGLITNSSIVTHYGTSQIEVTQNNDAQILKWNQ
ncbi:MAG: head GIN domain-containing protein [Candidatus Babeliales bacterium]